MDAMFAWYNAKIRVKLFNCMQTCNYLVHLISYLSAPILRETKAAILKSFIFCKGATVLMRISQ